MTTGLAMAWEVSEMCNFWSCILVRPGMQHVGDGKRVLWLRESNSHEDIIDTYELDDNKLADRDFVKYEIVPNDIMSADRDHWTLRLDEPRTLPEWYEQDAPGNDALVWAEWRVMIVELQQTLSRLDLSRRDAVVERVKALRPGDVPVARSTVRPALEEHRQRLMALDGEQRQWAISEVRFYSPAEWASARASVWPLVWASVWASVRASVWVSARDSARDSVWVSARDSVWASVWASVIHEDDANYGLPLLDMLAAGCVLYGIDDDGVAHVIMVGKDGGERQ